MAQLDRRHIVIVEDEASAGAGRRDRSAGHRIGEAAGLRTIGTVP